MDESFVQFYDPEAKLPSLEWRHFDCLKPRKLRDQKSTEKVLALVF